MKAINMRNVAAGTILGVLTLGGLTMCGPKSHAAPFSGGFRAGSFRPATFRAPAPVRPSPAPRAAPRPTPQVRPAPAPARHLDVEEAMPITHPLHPLNPLSPFHPLNTQRLLEQRCTPERLKAKLCKEKKPHA